MIVKTNFSLENVKCMETSALLDKQGRKDERDRSRGKRSSIIDRASQLRSSQVRGTPNVQIDLSSQNYLNNMDDRIEINQSKDGFERPVS